MAMVAVNSWGRLRHLDHPNQDIVALADRAQVHQQVTAHHPGLALGMGRSYGDVCLNPAGVLWRTTALDRFIGFDAATGRLRCEAGVLLRDIQQLFMPRGWTLAVTPGTQLVTVGGAIANDVHGKNHHVHGTFADHVRQLYLVRTDGTGMLCSPTSNPAWLAATFGGLGLTGVITEVEIQLKRVDGPWLDVETVPYASVDAFFTLADDSEQDWEYTVSWIDCLSAAGRGLFMRANSCAAPGLPVPQARQLTMPFNPPLSLVNPMSLRPFNALYFHLNKHKQARRVAHYESFFYPLDHVLEWNRLYGPQGFYQYQSVVPRAVGQDAVQAMLTEISRSGQGSFLAVLKTFGNRSSAGMMSFPMPGVTLALDFPNRGEKTQKLFERLDAVVREAGGRIYPAKDARMPRDLFVSGYPRLNEFLNYRDPGISSAMSRRLIGS